MFLSYFIDKDLSNKRLDIILYKLNLASSRQRALSLIINGKVFIGNNKIEKPGKIIKANQIIRIKKKINQWVSRGGIKLNHAIKELNIDVKNKICMDIGCSTGGFSQVLLFHNAKKIYAVDVGYGQFDWKLRNSDKIILMEKTNARFLSSKIIPEKIDFVVCDVSFISMKKVVLPCKEFLKETFEIITLIKPQFEASKLEVGKGGIIKNSDVHTQICKDIQFWFEENFKPDLIHIIDSPIKGQKGNKEFLIYVKKL